jgi:hypothetical protein
LLDILIVRYSVIMDTLASKVGPRATIVLLAKLRRRLGIEEGSFVNPSYGFGQRLRLVNLDQFL